LGSFSPRLPVEPFVRLTLPHVYNNWLQGKACYFPSTLEECRFWGMHPTDLPPPRFDELSAAADRHPELMANEHFATALERLSAAGIVENPVYVCLF
jgi:hypothetical protein